MFTLLVLLCTSIFIHVELKQSNNSKKTKVCFPFKMSKNVDTSYSGNNTGKQICTSCTSVVQSIFTSESFKFLVEKMKQ